MNSAASLVAFVALVVILAVILGLAVNSWFWLILLLVLVIVFFMR